MDCFYEIFDCFSSPMQHQRHLQLILLFKQRDKIIRYAPACCFMEANPENESSMTMQ